MSANRLIFLLNAVVVTGLAVLILFFVNLISLDRFGRYDLTEDKVNTLDSLSKEIAGRFQDTVTVRYYVTEDKFPPGAQFESLKQLVVDRLEEYAANSKNRMIVKVLDPRENTKQISKELREKLEAEGVIVSSHTIFEEELPKPVEFYSSIKLNYLDKTRVVNYVMDPANLEYQFTKALRDLQVFDIPEVGVYFAENETGWGQNGNYRNFYDVLKKDYSVRTVDLGDDDPVPDSVDVLFVMAPDEVPDRHKFEIDQFIMRGGKAVFCMESFDPRKMQRQNRWMGGAPAIYMKVQSKLDDLLASYGVKVGANIVFDLSCPYQEIPRQIMVEGIPVMKREKVKIPYIILSKNENYDKDLSFINQLDKIGFFLASTIEPTPAVLGEGSPVKCTTVLTTSGKSWTLDFMGPVMIGSNIEAQWSDPEKHQKEKNKEGRKFALIAVCKGTFTSLYRGKEAPDAAKKPEDKRDPRRPPEPKKPPRAKPKTVETSPETRIVVIGDADIFSDKALPYKPNVDFLENMMEWLSTDESLSKIKAKGSKPRPLDYDANKKGLYVALFVAGPTLLVFLAGVAVFALRKFEKSVFLKAVAPAAGGEEDEPPPPPAAQGPPSSPDASREVEPSAPPSEREGEQEEAPPGDGPPAGDDGAGSDGTADKGD